VERLDFSHNLIKTLGVANLCLKKLVSLNLEDNPLTNIKQTIDSVKLLAPNLKILKMTLTATSDVEYILAQLPNLEELNEEPTKEPLFRNQHICKQQPKPSASGLF
jgi:Leucine-rich repeat (LRR) protein